MRFGKRKHMPQKEMMDLHMVREGAGHSWVLAGKPEVPILDQKLQ